MMSEDAVMNDGSMNGSKLVEMMVQRVIDNALASVQCETRP